MENPQAQMPQGQAGPAQQQGGQDQMMQQIMQFIQQSLQQGAQPVDIAIQLIQQQVQPEMIMQVFVQMGMPEDQAQEAIETAMEGGQQQQGTGEEMLEGDASNPDEEAAEEGAQPMDQPGVMPPEMRYGGSARRQLKRYANGAAVDPNQELQAVMQQVQDMMDQGADARQVMEQIQAAAQQGQISPEVATSVLEQLSGMQQATNPQGSDQAMTAQSQDPQAMDPNMAAPEAQMMKFGGNLRKLMTKAYGGDAIPPSIDSKNYAQDRTAMFVNSVKNNAFKSTLDNEFPSLMGNQMAYGGELPKANNGFDVTKYKTQDEAELAAYRYRAGLSPEEQAKFDIGATLKNWKAPEPTYEAGKNYQYDPATKQFKVVDAPAQNMQGMMQPYGYGLNPVAYTNPMNQGLYGNAYAGASPFARLIAGSGNYYTDPRVTGANLPGGMNAAQFLGNVGGVNGLTTGMTGTIGDQTWKVTGAEKFKEGSIWKGNRRKGVRYNIDWTGSQPAPVAGPQNQVTPAPAGPAPAATTPAPTGSLSRMTPTGGSGLGAMEQMDEFGLPMATQPAPTVTATPPVLPPPVVPNQGMTSTGGSGLGALEQEGNVQSAPAPVQAPAAVVTPPVSTVTPPAQSTFRSTGSGLGTMEQNMDEFPSLATEPTAVNTANQTLVNPVNTDVINPSSEVNAVDQSQTQQVPVGMEMGAPFNPDYEQPQLYEFQAMTPEQRAARDAQFAPAPVPAAQVTPPAAVVTPPTRGKRRTVTNPVVTTPVTPPTAQTSNNPWDQDKSSNWYAPKNLDEIYAMKGKQKLDLFDQLDKNWKGKGRPTDEFRAQELKKMQDAARQRQQSYLSQQQKQQQINSRSNANLNSFAYGGGVDPVALENAVALINRAFGGMIPRANNGLNLGTEDTDNNNIPDYLQFENLPVNPNQGTIEASNAKKFNVDWNAAGDVYMSGASKVTNFANKMRAYNPERDQAKFSALNRPSETYDQMKQGLYDQAGNFIPNDIGNQVLNPTNVYYNNQRQIYAYGGNLYAMGGEVELDDNEMEQLAAAGFKFSRI